MPAGRRAVILYGAIDAATARPDESDGLAQVASVAKALDELGWAVETMPVTLDLSVLIEKLSARPPQLAFNLVEAIGGRDGLMPLIPPVLEMLDVPYTGARAEAASMTVNKLVAKRVMTAVGIPTPVWCEGGERPSVPGRWIVKSATEHASLGMDPSSVVDHRSVPTRIDQAEARFGGKWFAERYVHGREFNISLLELSEGPEVLPLAEMRFVDFPPDRPHIVDYRAKWAEGSFEDAQTVRTFNTTEAELAERLRALCLRCWHVFGLTGYARVDIRVDEVGEPHVLEINANPCIAPEIGIAAAAAEAGMSYTEMVGRIVEAALRGRERRSIAA